MKGLRFILRYPLHIINRTYRADDNPVSKVDSEQDVQSGLFSDVALLALYWRLKEVFKISRVFLI
jgi:hypothetical protein